MTILCLVRRCDCITDSFAFFNICETRYRPIRGETICLPRTWQFDGLKRMPPMLCGTCQ